jgi:hypothetical protein
MVITPAGLGLWIAELLALESKMSTFCDEQCGSSGSFRETGSAGFHPEHQDHDGCWCCRTWSPSSATARTEGPTGKPGRCGRQTSTAGSITYLMKTASATLKAVS